MSKPTTLPVLDTYAAHINRHQVEHRPRAWATHIDIWNEPRGEIGVPGNNTTIAVFAVLVPFFLVPSIGTSWLVTDCSDHEIRHVTVVKLKASLEGIEVESWRVPFSMDDDGVLAFDEPARGHGVPEPVKTAVAGVVSGRLESAFWADDLDYDTACMVAKALLI